ncbi:hypothetical protein FNV43_RR03529 [Rhamnella rubrinervis]|uniref:NB-ARC domain-containing protein n=1 Tax=Rhamnella rubrinervis TaxID=2594499 RepID=A0A8K0MPQ2_9ROSA|nr:hypothetical protein FNV43_RR03529 [Rhamnella rubrinervis]
MDILMSIASKIAELLVEPAAKQLQYLIFYKSNIQKLEEETEKLKLNREGVQLAMDEATRKSEVIAPVVKRWIADVDKETNELKRFLEEDVKANKMCLNGWLPNLKLQHYLGKTTMANEVARRAKLDKLFDEVVMVTVAQNPDIMRIQREIKDILGYTFKTETQLPRAGIPDGNEHSGCTILLTSRNIEVARNQMRSQRNFVIQVLAEQEAWKLFEEVAGTSINNPDLRPIAKQIVKECRGLPVAIVTVGRALENKNKEEWKDALRQLRKSIAENISDMNANVYSSIELSYNFLESKEAKSCFLLCCLFPEDHDIPIETLVRFGKGLRLFQGTETMEETRSSVESLVQTLKRCFLLLDSNKEDCVKMHDIVRDVAISIASKKEHGFVVRCDNEIEEWPEMDRREDCTRFSLVTNKIKKSLDSLRCPNLKLLHLSTTLLDRQEFNENFAQR